MSSTTAAAQRLAPPTRRLWVVALCVIGLAAAAGVGRVATDSAASHDTETAAVAGRAWR
jgi:hypothetical protein